MPCNGTCLNQTKSVGSDKTDLLVVLLIFSDDISVKSKRNRNKTVMAVSYDLLCCKGRDTRRHIPEVRKYCIYCHEDLKYCSYGLLCCKITALSWRN